MRMKQKQLSKIHKQLENIESQLEEHYEFIMGSNEEPETQTEWNSLDAVNTITRAIQELNQLGFRRN